MNIPNTIDDDENRVDQDPKELNKRRSAEPDPEDEDDEEFNKMYPIQKRGNKQP